MQAVRGLDLEVRVGECFGLLGPNGAGKTTTLEILEGLNTPTSGNVEVLGRRWASDEKELRERIGVTLQDTRFPGKSTVLETLRLFRSFYRDGLEPQEAIAMVALESKANAYVESLSGGQKQRLGIAVGMVGNPELLFFDEPTSGLDPQSRRQFSDLLRRLLDWGRTVVLATHSIDDAERLCDRVAIIDHGRIIASGQPSELIARLNGENVIEFSVVEGGRLPADAYSDLPAVRSARAEGDGYALTIDDHRAAIPALFSRLEQQGLTLGRLATRQVSLEDLFVSLTGYHLRDSDSDSGVSDDEAKPGRRSRWWRRTRRTT